MVVQQQYVVWGKGLLIFSCMWIEVLDVFYDEEWKQKSRYQNKSQERHSLLNDELGNMMTCTNHPFSPVYI